MVMVGALVAVAFLPLSREMFERQLRDSMSGDRLAMNLQAFGEGFGALEN
jgi:Pyruvate/2-oxoacid:ferredoxin oxidoreductase gamma subunit